MKLFSTLSFLSLLFTATLSTITNTHSNGEKLLEMKWKMKYKNSVNQMTWKGYEKVERKGVLVGSRVMTICKKSEAKGMESTPAKTRTVGQKVS